jgi:hypothetical protein
VSSPEEEFVSAEPTTARVSILAARPSLPSHVVHRPFPTETVVLNIDTGKYHGLNLVAGRMLEELTRQETVGDAARLISEEYGQPLEEIEADICELCVDLGKRGLMELDGKSGN